MSISYIKYLEIVNIQLIMVDHLFKVPKMSTPSQLLLLMKNRLKVVVK